MPSSVGSSRVASCTWLRGGILRIEQPFHEIGQIFTGAEEMGFDMSIFRADRPDYAEILAVRAERQQLVTDFLAGATAEVLAEQWPNPTSLPLLPDGTSQHCGARETMVG